jgi:uncharacterized protein
MAMRKPHAAIRDLIAPIFAGDERSRYSVYLYGSRAGGFERADSDYDFALAAPDPLDKAELESLREALAEALPGDGGVDCVDMRRIPLTLAVQVIGSGLVLLPGDSIMLARLETRLMSMYASLNEERSGILEDIVERGSVYAR